MTVGVIQDGRLALLKSYGPENRVDRDAVHASVSKPMTSVLFLRLLRQGVIRSLDGEIGAYAEKYRDVMPAAYTGGKITFRRLLTHTSGVPHLDKPLWTGGKLNLLFPPGARFSYSSNGYAILGELMAAAAGKSFSDLVKEHIGRPVGASSFWAENHFRAPAARIHSTPRDFLRFAEGIIDNRYLTQKEFDDLLVGKSRGLSLGWGTGGIGTDDLTLAHSGSNGRPRSHLLIKPKKRIALTLMGETKSRESDIWFLYLAPILLDILEGKGGY
jgi:CubicO group peptidase (beta-lactamase class C family)